jgi:hypothetical protein
MLTQPLLRFLAMVERELDASRAEIVLTDHPPEEGVAWAAMLHGFRVEVKFAQETDLAAAQTRLEALVESFAGVLAEAALPAVREVPNTIVNTLEDALVLLVHQARAESAWVIDDTTPEIWGSSFRYDALSVTFASEYEALSRLLASHGSNIPAVLAMESPFSWLAEKGITGDEAAEVARDIHRLSNLKAQPEGAQLRAIRAIAACRDALEDETVQAFERRFAGIYTLILVFEGAHSELHAEAAVLRALPTIEKLVTSLPPRDPVPQGAKVARLRRLRRV